MSRNHRWRWSSPLVRVGLVSGSLLALGLLLIGQPAGQAETSRLSPQQAAVVRSKDKLQVTLHVAHLRNKKLPDQVPIRLVDAKGKTVARGQAQRLKGWPTYYRTEIPAGRASPERLRLICRLNGEDYGVFVRRLLLAKAHETALAAGTEFFAGSTAALRCDVHAVRSFTETLPLAGARVELTLRMANGKGKPFTLFSGKTGKNGIAEPRFQVPSAPAGNYVLEMTTRSPLGEQKLQRQVQVKTDSKILLVTDKPLYQPGQTVHIRALALRPFDLKPVAESGLVFEVEDAKGNKVFKKPEHTSPFGVATADFELADEVNAGAYQVRAIMGQQQAQKTVTVKPYVLPKFKVDVQTDKRFYLPKETVKGEVQTDYFFGKPVAGGKVKVTASTFDVAFRAFQTWQGKTDANGHAKFEIKLPDYFVGQPLQKGNALLRLEVQITDTADHTETVNRSYPVSDQSIRVSLIPEGGRLVPDMENRIYAAALYPDGNPAACALSLWLGRQAKGKPLATLKTNAAGLAEFTIKPKANQFRRGQWEMQTIEMLGGNAPQIWDQKLLLDLVAQAKDQSGNVAQTVAEVNSQPLGENVLLRLDKAIYQDGDTVAVDIRSSAGLPTVYLDVIKNGQTLLTRWLDVKNGRAEHRLDLPQNIFGTLEIHAYQMLHSGEIIRDSRVIYVNPRNDLKIKVKADRDVYLPGQNGRIHFEVTDAAGKPTAAALGIIIVDEAVYALQEMQPGLEKVYFTLQEELLKPQAQIAYKPNESIDNLVRRRVLPAPQQQVAQVLLTAVRPKAPARWQVAPVEQRQQQMDAKLQQIGWAFYNYAQNLQDFQEFDKENKSWEFRPHLIEEMKRANYLNDSMLTDPLGGRLTLEKLARTNHDFTAERLADRVNYARLSALAWALVNHSNQNRNAWLKGDKWTFPKSALADAAKRIGYNGKWLTDVWGTPYRLVKLKRKQDNKTGQSQFDYYRLVSAGPDRKFGTKDDIAWLNPNAYPWSVNQWWWTDESSRLGKANNQGGFRFRDRGLRREMLMFGAVGLKDAAGVGGAFPQGAARPFPAKAAARKGKKSDRAANKATGGGFGPPMRVREYFPETLRWEPALITDDQGNADLTLTFADSITTWRLSASASSRAGALGGVSAPLRVFQDFFVDIDLPVRLTQNDEVAFPVAVYNYLKTPQTVRLELKKQPWFSLIDGAGYTRSLDLKPNEVTSVKFRIKANRIGFQPLQVKAFGSKMSDAVKRLIEVVPDGKRIEQVITDRLTGKVTQVIDIPPFALADASKIMVKLYPGVMSQVLEGAEGLLRLPGG
jgi:hypothetical protein